MNARVNGISLAYDLAGAEGRPAVVLHHPLAANRFFWDDLAHRLGHDYRVLRLDARGHGESDAPTGPYSFETLAQDVVALMDHARIERACFLGLSMGGMVGQYLGLGHAARFNSLILVATSSRVPKDFGPVWDARIKAVSERGMASQVEDSMPRWMSAKAIAAGHPAIPGLKAMIRNTPPAGYIGWAGAIRNLDLTDRIKAIRLPTLVVSGELDPSTPPAAGQAIHGAIPGSKFVVMTGVAHMMSSEAPEAFHAIVRPFIDLHAGR
jgi:3-oxoadipate enol-lactonase